MEMARRFNVENMSKNVAHDPWLTYITIDQCCKLKACEYCEQNQIYFPSYPNTVHSSES